jgi:hypothetical protein
VTLQLRETSADVPFANFANLTTHPLALTASRSVVVRIDDPVPPDSFFEFVHFLLCGRVHIGKPIWCDLLLLATRLGAWRLYGECTRWAASHLRPSDILCLFHERLTTTAFCDDLIPVITSNFRCYGDLPLFAKLPIPVLKRIVASAPRDPNFLVSLVARIFNRSTDDSLALLDGCPLEDVEEVHLRALWAKLAASRPYPHWNYLDGVLNRRPGPSCTSLLDAWSRSLSGDQAHSHLVLGELYEAGTFVAADLTRGFDHFLASAQLGNPAALFRVGRCYELGRGVAKDPLRAQDFYARAAAAGDRDATIRVAADLLQAEKLPSGGLDIIRRAADLGDGNSQFAIAVHLADSRENVRAINYLAQAAASGHPNAERFRVRLRHRGVEAEAAKTFNRALSRGDATCGRRGLRSCDTCMR